MFPAMFETYIATKKDFDTIKEALKYLNKKELDFIFSERKLLKNTALVTYDSKFMYIIQQGGAVEKIEHNTKILDDDHLGWRASVTIEALKGKLTNTNLTYISGPFPTPFIELHKKKRTSPYTSKESYMATIIHEFGHVYYENVKNSWFSDYNRNVNILETVVDLYEGKSNKLKDLIIKLPESYIETEIFAFCTDYTATSLFWPEYKKVLDVNYLRSTKKYLKIERENKSTLEESVLDDPHIASVAIGKILIEKYGNKWVDILLVMDRVVS